MITCSYRYPTCSPDFFTGSEAGCRPDVGQLPRRQAAARRQPQLRSRPSPPKGPSGPGYKLHAIWAGQPVPAAWEVTAAGVGEAPVAERLVGRADAGGYLVADGNYDSSPLFDAAARLRLPVGGRSLVAQRRRRPPPREPAPPAEHRPAADGLRPVAVRGAWRDRAFLRQRRRLRGRPGARRRHGFDVGIGVDCWVLAKLTINGVRIVQKQGLMVALQ